MEIQTIQVDWPDVTPWTIAGIILFIVLVIMIYLVMRRYYRLKVEKDMCWFKLLSLAHRRELSIKQINILRDFFKTLKHDVCISVVSSDEGLKNALFKYLDRRGDIETPERLVLIENLFNGKDAQHAVTSLDDLYEGEPCGLEYGDTNSLGRIIQLKIPYVLVHVPRMKGDRSLRGYGARLYVHRPGVGGYALEGSIYQTGDEYIYFKHHGPIEELKDRGIIVDVELLVQLKIWPEKDGMLENKKKSIRGITEKISERVFTFSFNSDEDYSLYNNNRNEIWQLSLPLSENTTFFCRGRIIPPRDGDNEEIFYFKYIDVSESNFEKLFQFLVEHNPRRGDITVVS